MYKKLRKVSIKNRREKKLYSSKFFIFIFSAIFLGVLCGIAYSYAKPLFGTTLFISPLPKDVKNNTFQKSLAIEINKVGLNYSSIVYSDDSSYVVTLKNGEMVIFSTGKSVVSQVSSLQLILKRLTIEGKSFKMLDLRFNKPVIKAK